MLTVILVLLLIYAIGAVVAYGLSVGHFPAKYNHDVRERDIKDGQDFMVGSWFYVVFALLNGYAAGFSLALKPKGSVDNA